MPRTCCCDLAHLTKWGPDLIVLMALGMSNRAVAVHLHLSRDTVAHHVSDTVRRAGRG